MLATMKYAVDYYKIRATAAGSTAPQMTLKYNFRAKQESGW